MEDLRHDRLSKLFKDDPDQFEKERKKLIEEVITSAPPDQQLKLRLLQAKWDKAMRGAGSPENRFAMAQGLFWGHFFDVWKPSIDEFNLLLNGRKDEDQ